MIRRFKNLFFSRYVGLALLAAMPGLAVFVYALRAEQTRVRNLTDPALQLPGLESTEIPGVYLRHRTISLGTVVPDQIASATFELINKTSGDITVDHVTPKCGCTVVEFHRSVIHAGASLLIPSKLDARRVGSDEFIKSISVAVQLSDSPGIDTLTMFLAGRLDHSREFIFVPQVIDLEEVAVKAGDVRRNLIIYGPSSLLNAIPAEVKIKLDGSQKIALNYTYDGQEMGITSKSIVIDCKVDPNARVGTSFNQEIMIEIKGPVSHKAVIPIQGKFVTMKHVDPHDLYFFLNDGDKLPNAPIQIYGIHGQNIQYDISPSNLSNDLQITFTDQSTFYAKFNVRITSTDIPYGVNEGHIKIKCNEQTQEMIQIPFFIVKNGRQ